MGNPLDFSTSYGWRELGGYEDFTCRLIRYGLYTYACFGQHGRFTVVATAAVTGLSLRLHRLGQADFLGHCLCPRHPPELAEHEAGTTSAAPGVPCSPPP